MGKLKIQMFVVTGFILTSTIVSNVIQYVVAGPGVGGG